jgi:hypothetical protein
VSEKEVAFSDLLFLSSLPTSTIISSPFQQLAILDDQQNRKGQWYHVYGPERHNLTSG